MRLGTAIEKLVENYNYAVGKEWVQDKVAWALYHTWKEADEHRAKQTEPQTRTDEDGRVWEYRNGNWWQLGKTESNSEKPNNCEHITEDGVTCAKYPACDDCLDNPLNKVKGSERLVKSSEQTEPTISKMEQVEPQTCSFSDCDNFKNPDYARCIECKRGEWERSE